MNKKSIITILALFVVAIAAVAFLVIDGRSGKIVADKDSANPTAIGPIDISKITNEQIVSLLRTNPDSAGYINKYKDFKITSAVALTKDSIASGQAGQNFKEVYQDLELEDGRYMRVDLMNQEGNYGMITVLDLNTGSVLKAFAMLLMQAGVQTK